MQMTHSVTFECHLILETHRKLSFKGDSKTVKRCLGQGLHEKILSFIKGSSVKAQRDELANLLISVISVYSIYTCRYIYINSTFSLKIWVKYFTHVKDFPRTRCDLIININIQ